VACLCVSSCASNHNTFRGHPSRAALFDRFTLPVNYPCSKGLPMPQIPRHQCMVYEGPVSFHLRSISLAIQDRLLDNYKCVYLHSEPMIADTKSSLATAGVDVAFELQRSNLILSSARPHLVEGHFEIDEMLQSLKTEFDRAMNDGYAGIWAT